MSDPEQQSSIYQEAYRKFFDVHLANLTLQATPPGLHENATPKTAIDISKWFSEPLRTTEDHKLVEMAGNEASIDALNAYDNLKSRVDNQIFTKDSIHEFVVDSLVELWMGEWPQTSSSRAVSVNKTIDVLTDFGFHQKDIEVYTRDALEKAGPEMFRKDADD